MAFPPVHAPAYGLSAEALEYARQRYEETEDSQRSIAEDIGKSRGTLDRIAKAQGWKLRKDQPPRGLVPGSETPDRGHRGGGREAIRGAQGRQRRCS